MKYILAQVEDENVIYDFNKEVCFEDKYKNNVVICGNRRFKSYGRNDLINIINENYKDEDKINKLNELTHKKWNMTFLTGYNQGDWQYIYYVEDEVNKEEIEYLEAFYMDKVSEYLVETDGDCYHTFVPHTITWKNNKKDICDYIGIDYNETQLLKYVGFHKVSDYEEIK